MNKIRLLALPAVAAALLTPLSASAQFGGVKLASAAAAVQPAAVARGSRGVLRITLTVKPTYHINASKPNDPA